MDIEKYINDMLVVVNDRMKELLSSTNKSIGTMCEWLLKNRGKQLRPRYMIASSAYFGENSDIIEYAAIIELFHMATLIHDDVIDRADFRRGQLSINKKFGAKNAVYLGDYIIFSVLKNTKLKESDNKKLTEAITDCISKICYGELGQDAHLFDLSITKEEYLKNIEGKTAALFEMAFKLPSIINEADIQTIKKFETAGRAYGMLFQINDDLMDFFSNPLEIGKPIYQDLSNGIYTLPIIIAAEKNEYREKLSNVFEKSKTKPLRDRNEQIMEIIKCSNSLSGTYEIAEDIYHQGMNALNDLDENDSTTYLKAQMNCIIHKIVEKQHCFN